MTTEENKDAEKELVFRKMKDIKREPIREKTDEEILAEMHESVRRNIKALRTLAKM